MSGMNDIHRRIVIGCLLRNVPYLFTDVIIL